MVFLMLSMKYFSWVICNQRKNNMQGIGSVFLIPDTLKKEFCKIMPSVGWDHFLKIKTGKFRKIYSTCPFMYIIALFILILFSIFPNSGLPWISPVLTLPTSRKRVCFNIQKRGREGERKEWKKERKEMF